MRQLIGAMTIAFGLGLSGGAHAAITGSSHDFTDNCTGKSGNSSACGSAVKETDTATVTGGWNTRGEICRVCHVPHDHNRTLYTQGLLWNHAASTITNYNVYTSSTMDAATGQPQGRSKLCLGCHDGSVAVSAFDSNHTTGSSGGSQFLPDGTTPNPTYVAPVYIGGASGQTYSSGYNVGKSGNLAGTHPISIAYPTAGGKGIRALASAPNWLGAITVADTLEDGRIECSTCHDVHSQNYAFSGTTYSHLLRQAQNAAQGGTASQLCFTCHDK